MAQTKDAHMATKLQQARRTWPPQSLPLWLDRPDWTLSKRKPGR